MVPKATAAALLALSIAVAGHSEWAVTLRSRPSPAIAWAIIVMPNFETAYAPWCAHASASTGGDIMMMWP